MASHGDDQASYEYISAGVVAVGTQTRLADAVRGRYSPRFQVDIETSGVSDVGVTVIAVIESRRSPAKDRGRFSVHA